MNFAVHLYNKGWKKFYNNYVCMDIRLYLNMYVFKSFSMYIWFSTK